MQLHSQKSVPWTATTWITAAGRGSISPWWRERGITNNRGQITYLSIFIQRRALSGRRLPGDGIGTPADVRGNGPGGVQWLDFSEILTLGSQLMTSAQEGRGGRQKKRRRRNFIPCPPAAGFLSRRSLEFGQLLPCCLTYFTSHLPDSG